MTGATAQPKKPSVAGVIHDARICTFDSCQLPPRNAVPSTTQARRAWAYTRFWVILTSSPADASSRRCSRSSPTWPTWNTSTVWAAAQSTGPPAHGKAAFAPAASTFQHEPTCGAAAGGVCGIFREVSRSSQ